MDEVIQDVEGQGALQVVGCRIGKNGDADLQFGQPPQVGEKAEAASTVWEENGFAAAMPLRPGDAQGIPFQATLGRGRDREHLVQQSRVKQVVTVDTPPVDLELEELRHVAGTGV